jgi:hypothetical protein
MIAVDSAVTEVARIFRPPKELTPNRRLDGRCRFVVLLSGSRDGFGLPSERVTQRWLKSSLPKRTEDGFQTLRSDSFTGPTSHMTASTTYTDTSDLSGFLKPVFGELQWLLPEDSLCQKTFAFNAANSVGQYFTEPLQVTTSWGVSFLGSDTSVQALNESVPSNTVPAQVTPYLTVLNDKISYGMFDRGARGREEGLHVDGCAYVGKNLAMQMRRILEISMPVRPGRLRHRRDVQLERHGSVVVTAASLRPGVLAILEGARIDVVRTGNLYANNGGSTSIAGIGITVLAVDIDARTITFSALPFMGSGAATLAAGDILFLHGAAGQAPCGQQHPRRVAVSYMEMIGLRKQISATTGTIFAVNKATYLAVRGNTVTSIGPISAGAILKCVAKAVNRGLQGRAVCFISPTSWQELNSRNIAQQVFDQSYSPAKAEVGTDAIVLKRPGRDGRGVQPRDDARRRADDSAEGQREAHRLGLRELGADGDTDISFMIPGTNAALRGPGARLQRGEGGVPLDQQIYLQKPAHAVHGTGITHV